MGHIGCAQERVDEMVGTQQARLLRCKTNEEYILFGSHPRLREDFCQRQQRGHTAAVVIRARGWARIWPRVVVRTHSKSIPRGTLPVCHDVGLKASRCHAEELLPTSLVSPFLELALQKADD